MSVIYRWIAGALAGLTTILMVWLNVTQKQRDKAQRRADSADTQIQGRNKADTASKDAKDQGDERIEEVRKEAVSGRRDHFERGMHDD